jgi:hypothetical protein
MTFQGALIREQGVTFAIAVVKPTVLQDQVEADRTRRGFSAIFGSVPIVLMAQDNRGVPTYSGRRDIVRFLANKPMSAIPWREYRVN